MAHVVLTAALGMRKRATAFLNPQSRGESKRPLAFLGSLQEQLLLLLLLRLVGSFASGIGAAVRTPASSTIEHPTAAARRTFPRCAPALPATVLDSSAALPATVSDPPAAGAATVLGPSAVAGAIVPGTCCAPYFAPAACLRGRWPVGSHLQSWNNIKTVQPWSNHGCWVVRHRSTAILHKFWHEPTNKHSD